MEIIKLNNIIRSYLLQIIDLSKKMWKKDGTIHVNNETYKIYFFEKDNTAVIIFNLKKEDFIINEKEIVDSFSFEIGVKMFYLFKKYLKNNSNLYSTLKLDDFIIQINKRANSIFNYRDETQMPFLKFVINSNKLYNLLSQYKNLYDNIDKTVCFINKGQNVYIYILTSAKGVNQMILISNNGKIVNTNTYNITNNIVPNEIIESKDIIEVLLSYDLITQSLKDFNCNLTIYCRDETPIFLKVNYITIAIAPRAYEGYDIEKKEEKIISCKDI